MSLYIREGDPIPATHYVSDAVVIPALKLEQIDGAELRQYPIDVTSLIDDGCHRHFICAAPKAIIRLVTGEVLIWPSDWAHLAILHGGGAFWVCEENPEYGCITQEQHEDALREEAELDAPDALDWCEDLDEEP